MPNATVRAAARTLPKSAKAAPEGIAREVFERLLKDEAAAKKDAPALPKTVKFDDEYLRLQAEKIVADARLEVATEDRQKAARAKAEAEVEEPKLRASREFGGAYYAWAYRESQDRRSERRGRGSGRA